MCAVIYISINVKLCGLIVLRCGNTKVDKIGKGYQGDPASALLELLDPNQNEVMMAVVNQWKTFHRFQHHCSSQLPVYFILTIITRASSTTTWTCPWTSARCCSSALPMTKAVSLGLCVIGWTSFDFQVPRPDPPCMNEMS